MTISHDEALELLIMCATEGIHIGMYQGKQVRTIIYKHLFTEYTFHFINDILVKVEIYNNIVLKECYVI